MCENIYNNMKRLLFSFLIFTCVAFHSSAVLPAQSLQAVNKSESDKFVQNLVRIKSDEIDYAYISFSMIKQMLRGATVGMKIDEIVPVIGSIKSLRRFSTTGSEGYYKLKSALKPFLQKNEKVLGMELMAINRESGLLSVIYAGSENVLVINDSGDDELSVVYIAGLNYASLMELDGKGINVDFGF